MATTNNIFSVDSRSQIDIINDHNRQPLHHHHITASMSTGSTSIRSSLLSSSSSINSSGNGSNNVLIKGNIRSDADINGSSIDIEKKKHHQTESNHHTSHPTATTTKSKTKRPKWWSRKSWGQRRSRSNGKFNQIPENEKKTKSKAKKQPEENKQHQQLHHQQQKPKSPQQQHQQQQQPTTIQHHQESHQQYQQQCRELNEEEEQLSLSLQSRTKLLSMARPPSILECTTLIANDYDIENILKESPSTKLLLDDNTLVDRTTLIATDRDIENVLLNSFLNEAEITSIQEVDINKEENKGRNQHSFCSKTSSSKSSTRRRRYNKIGPKSRSSMVEIAEEGFEVSLQVPSRPPADTSFSAASLGGSGVPLGTKGKCNEKKHRKEVSFSSDLSASYHSATTESILNNSIISSCRRSSWSSNSSAGSSCSDESNFSHSISTTSSRNYFGNDSENSNNIAAHHQSRSPSKSFLERDVRGGDTGKPPLWRTSSNSSCESENNDDADDAKSTGSSVSINSSINSDIICSKELGDGEEEETYEEIPYRFLRAGKNDPEMGWIRFEETLTWRRENNIDSILKEPSPRFDLIKKHYPHYFHGFGKKGEPVFYEMPPKTNLKALKSGGVTVECLLRHYFMVTEFQWQYLARDDRMKSIYVLDLEGVKVFDFMGDAVDFVKTASSFCSQHYPERAGHVYIVNAPSWFGLIWKVVQPLIDESTLKKIHVISSKSDSKETKAKILDRLSDVIDAENIPKEYGGTSAYPLGKSPEEQQFHAMISHNNIYNSNNETDTASTNSACGGRHGNPPCDFCTFKNARNY